MDPVIVPIHTKVRGRIRFKIASFNPSPSARQTLGMVLRRLSGVDKVFINSVTNSILVFYDPRQEWHTFVDKIAGVIEKPLVKNSNDTTENIDKLASLPDSMEGAHPWHKLQAGHVLDLIGSSMDRGLDSESVADRMRLHGGNVIHEAHVKSRTEALKDQFRFLPMALLLTESVAALLGGAVIEAAMLSAIAAVNAMAGYFIDRRAEQTIAAFKHRPRPPARVLRGGAWVDLPGEELVIGDILKLSAGSYVGADCRILASSHLKTDESILTGESNPVDKHAGVVSAASTPLFDQHNMAFMGTLVVGGDGLAVVVATGPMTAYGQLNALFDETIPPQTPLISKIHALSGTLLKLSLAAGAGVGLIGLLRGRSFVRAIDRAVSLTASAVPAGLLSAATVNMAFGFRKLRQKDVAIRRLYSLESLSAVQIICFDKTGTLTRSRIDVQQIYCSGKEVRVDKRSFRKGQKPFSPPPFSPPIDRPDDPPDDLPNDLIDDPDLNRLLQACVLCSESGGRLDASTGRPRLTGSPTETALLHMAMMTAFDFDGIRHQYPLQKILHRGDLRRYMMTFHAAPGGGYIVFVKGDPSDVLDLCAWEQRDGHRVKLSETAENAIEAQNRRMAAEALRVLGFAFGTLAGLSDEDLAAIGGLTWIGLVGMAEPIKRGVISLMDRLHQAGIQTVMITGDQSTTAEAVARRIRLSGKPDVRIFDSARFDALTPELASALIRDVEVFTRFNPAQKLRIIQAYQQRGLVVAMTGDGINDGPALRAADVGIAMGLSGTHAAREVADMVLERDNIASVYTAILEGRAAYRNLKRALRYFITTNFSDMLLASVAAVIGPGADPSAFRPVQIDLFTGLTPGLALLNEPARPNIGREPPRDRREPLLSHHDMFGMFTESAVLAGGALAAFGYGLLRHGPGARAATLAYESLTSAKLLHALTCRPRTPHAPPDAQPDAPKTEQAPTNPLLNFALVATLLAQAGTMLIPGLRRLLKIAPMSPADLMVIGFSALATRLVNSRVRETRHTGTDKSPSPHHMR